MLGKAWLGLWSAETPPLPILVLSVSKKRDRPVLDPIVRSRPVSKKQEEEEEEEEKKPTPARKTKKKR